MDWSIAAEAIWFIFPAYLANSSAVVVGGGPPIDFGKKWNGKRILGNGKTWRGFFGGIIIGTAGGLIMNIVIPETFGKGISSLIVLFSISFGALSGDLLESFFKRRLGRKRGEKWLLADQIDFLLGAFFFSFLVSMLLENTGMTDKNWFLSSFSAWHILFLLIFTPVLHYIVNLIGYPLGLKKVPW
ncbi:MAG: CDP-2,3-bis-(O-geranylgeranyl)-sn-glycerol synthase [Candidatus Thermoplasmatota archaeon]|nr:CDP-2,3-bis-(O-geranylgeranyl)-sn-glycerol synthase [Candidatus Thermoplasmatota archaeon]